MALIPSAAKWIQHRSPACLVLALAMAVIALPPRTAAARTWHVPGDAPTIQAAFDSTEAGDVVELASGTFSGPGNRNVWFPLWPITIRSQEGQPSSCIVDCQGAEGFRFWSNPVPPGYVVSGFTIINADQGIECGSASPQISNMVFFHCTSNTAGAGIHSFGNGTTVSDCRFIDNHGGGISISQGTVTRCTFESNSGGAATCGSGVTLTDCDFTGNSGGGCSCSGSDDMLSRCRFYNNTADVAGGGLSLFNNNGVVDHCLFIGNTAGVYGGGVYLSSESTTRFIGCSFGGNQAMFGGAVSVLTGVESFPAFSSCTFAQNMATESGSGLYVNTGATVENVIIAFAPQGEAIKCWGNVAISCSDLFGNAGGDWTGPIQGRLGQDGNIAEDPLFCDLENSFLIREDSPCAPEHNPSCGLIGSGDVGCEAPLSGACCVPDGSCVVLEEQVCLDEHGTYEGNGTTCDPNPCESTPTRATSWGRIKEGFR